MLLVQVADVKDRVKQLMDKNLNPGERMYRARTVGTHWLQHK